MRKMNVPLSDLTRQYAALRDEIETAVNNVLASGKFIMGDQVRKFEKDFADYIGTGYAVGVANGTDALVIALKAVGIKPGDEVITTPFTFFATAESISLIGATPVFVDVRLDTFNLDETKIEEAITDKTKAIMPVHIFGQSCEMDAINRIAKKYNLRVIEDACQAAGAEYKNKRCGSLSDVACFSFFPTKNLSCAGDGGIITTDDKDVATICDALRRHGSGETGLRAHQLLNGSNMTASNPQDNNDNTVYNPAKYYNYLIGHNSRLDEMQASILNVKLPRLDGYIAKRRAAAFYYDKTLKNLHYIIPYEDPAGKHSYHLYVLQSDERDRTVNKLADHGVATGVYYPVPMHRQMVYVNGGFKGGYLPNAEYLAKRAFAIPMFPEITEEEMAAVVEGLIQ